MTSVLKISDGFAATLAPAAQGTEILTPLKLKNNLYNPMTSHSATEINLLINLDLSNIVEFKSFQVKTFG